MHPVKASSARLKIAMGTHVVSCFKVFLVTVVVVLSVEASNRVTEDKAMESMSPLFHRSRHCINVILFEDFLPVGATEKQQIIVSHDSALERKDWYIQTLNSYWCAIGWTGEKVVQNVTSLKAITGLVRLVPQHIVLLEGGKSPSKRELDLQNRKLIWKHKTEKVPGFFPKWQRKKMKGLILHRKQHIWGIARKLELLSGRIF